MDSNQTAHEAGIRTSVDVLSAQQQFFASKRDLVAARYQYLLNIIRLNASVGVIGDFGGCKFAVGGEFINILFRV